MKKWQVISAVLLGLILGLMNVVSNPIQAQTTPQFNRTQYRSAFAKEQLTISTSSLGLTASVYNPTLANGQNQITSRAEFADIECDAHNVRVWMTGAAPTASAGILFSTGQLYTVQGYHDISNFHAISADGSDATCNIQYYRYSTNTP